MKNKEASQASHPSIPTAHLRRAIAVEAVCEERAVARIYAGLAVRETTAIRVLAAIEKLGAPKPPTPVTR